MMNGFYKGAALAALASALVLTAACKDNNNTATTSVATSAAASPAATAQIAPTTVVPTASATVAAASPAAGASGAAATVNEITTDNKFSVTSIKATVGQPLTINVMNKGTAIHNFDILNATGAETGPNKTDFVNSGETKSITLTFTKAGTYNFHCDVHPTEMTGTVTVTQ